MRFDGGGHGFVISRYAGNERGAMHAMPVQFARPNFCELFRRGRRKRPLNLRLNLFESEAGLLTGENLKKTI